MDETNNLAPRERPASSEALQQRSPFLALDLMPREPHLLDYLLVLRKHQWLITFFLLAGGDLGMGGAWHVAGGWMGLLTGLDALYVSFAEVTNETFKTAVQPLGAPILRG